MLLLDIRFVEAGIRNVSQAVRSQTGSHKDS